MFVLLLCMCMVCVVMLCVYTCVVYAVIGGLYEYVCFLYCALCVHRCHIYASCMHSVYVDVWYMYDLYYVLCMYCANMCSLGVQVCFVRVRIYGLHILC